jgi:hypothetical protein
MLKLSTKCSVVTLNAQGLRGFIVVVQVGAVKIYLAAVEALRKKERQGETQEPRWFSEVHSPLNANVLFYRIFFEWFSEVHSPLNANVLFYRIFF